jgi:hypothetical protein
LIEVSAPPREWNGAQGGTGLNARDDGRGISDSRTVHSRDHDIIRAGGQWTERKAAIRVRQGLHDYAIDARGILLLESDHRVAAEDGLLGGNVDHTS